MFTQIGQQGVDAECVCAGVFESPGLLEEAWLPQKCGNIT